MASNNREATKSKLGVYMLKTRKLLLCSLKDYGIILGKDWHNIYSSDVEFPSNTLRFHFKGKKNL